MMKLWFTKKIDKTPKTQDFSEKEELVDRTLIDTSNICVADSISPGDFQVFTTLKGKAQGKVKAKETKFKRLQYLSVVLIFSVSLVTHSYVFLEQHLVKAVVTPIVLMISGFFYDKVWAASDAKPKSEEGKPGGDPNAKSDPAAPPPNAKPDPNISPASPENNTSPAPAGSSPATPAAGASSPSSNSGGETPSTTPPSPANNASPTNTNPSTFPANSGAQSTPTSFKGDANKKEEKKNGESRFDPLSLDETRVKILLSLNDREKELKKWEELLQARENIVKSLEVQLQRRGKELNDLKATIESLSKANNQYAEKNLKKLVDIYEAMKPPAAAKIFDDLPQSVLVGLIKAMNQKKASAIMAVMNQDKVRALTNILAMIPQVPEKELKKA